MTSFPSDDGEQVFSLHGQDHSVFETIALMISTYEVVSMTAFSTLGQYRSRAHGIDSWFLDSISGTLDSIRLCLSRGHISDAYGLLRSVVERTWLHTYLLDRSCQDDMMVQIETDSPEAFSESLVKHFGTEDWYDRAIEDWIAGRKPLPALREIRPSLQMSQHLVDLNALFPSNEDKEISDRCNDHLHVNFAKFLFSHYDGYRLDKLVPACNQIEIDLKFVISKHLTHLFFFRQSYMASDDYVGSLDCGLEPEEGSQYWVAPVVQEFYDKLVSPKSPGIVDFLRAQTSMEIAELRERKDN